MAVSLTLGVRSLAFSDYAAAFTNSDQYDPDHVTVVHIRLPRMIAGGALEAAGSLMQALTRNPLPNPGLLGVNAGAAFALIISSGRQAKAISLYLRFPARHSLRWQSLALAAGSRGMPGRCA
nr:iron chelate uptake ABC transporter family permease subunit [Heliomarina baculiformis]